MRRVSFLSCAGYGAGIRTTGGGGGALRTSIHHQSATTNAATATAHAIQRAREGEGSDMAGALAVHQRVDLLRHLEVEIRDAALAVAEKIDTLVDG